jgi:hypothetical protein
MDLVPQNGYYAGGYGYSSNDYGPNFVVRSSGSGPSGYIWSSAAPPPAPPLLLPPPPPVTIQPVPVATRSVVYDDYRVVRDPPTTRTTRLTDDDLKDIAEDLQRGSSNYSSLVVSGEQSDGNDIIIVPSKPVKWRILRQQKVQSSKTSSKTTAVSTVPVASYVTPPGNGYLVQGVPQFYQPSSAAGGYYVPASTPRPDIVYQPASGYYL